MRRLLFRCCCCGSGCCFHLFVSTIQCERFGFFLLIVFTLSFGGLMYTSRFWSLSTAFFIRRKIQIHLSRRDGHCYQCVIIMRIHHFYSVRFGSTNTLFGRATCPHVDCSKVILQQIRLVDL